ncbi:MAG: 16S rRNA (cytidine(1402)-2'-O)-methyltransferase [Actinomycetota bacterium]
MAGTLFLVGTPIGNLADLSERARETLARADVIAAEDTRRTGRLLASLGLPKRAIVSNFDGNERERVGELLARLRDGASVALVTDGGMPSVSDPGYRLVAAALDAGIDVRVVPGPSAAIAALVASGLPTDRFVFEGFWPRTRSARVARMRALASEPRTIVAFESPKRVRATLADVVDTLGDREVALARELTKLHEEILRGRASAVLALLGGVDPKGELVLVLRGAPAGAASAGAAADDLAEARRLIGLGLRPRDAAKEVARRSGASANALYEALTSDDA